MGVNNEHSLRRRMQKLLGRPVTPAAWEIAAEKGYVRAALGPAHATGEDDLRGYLEELLRVRDEGLVAHARSTNIPGAAQLPHLAARIVAVSRIAAEEAAGDEEILRFRERVLGRETTMTPEEAEEYLD